MSYQLRMLVEKPDQTVENVEAWFEEQKKKPSGLEQLQIARNANKEIRDYLCLG